MIMMRFDCGLFQEFNSLRCASQVVTVAVPGLMVHSFISLANMSFD